MSACVEWFDPLVSLPLIKKRKPSCCVHDGDGGDDDEKDYTERLEREHAYKGS